jgi:hypothetical protein
MNDPKKELDMILLMLAVTAIAVALLWVLYGRPVFERMGWFNPLPDEALEGWRDRLAAWVRNSATVALGKLQVWFGVVLELALQLGDVLNVPGLREQLEFVGLGRAFAIALVVVGVLTILARTRKGSGEPV